MSDEVVDRIRRPPGLTNVKSAFALYVVGQSMEPRFREGDIIYIHPVRRPAPRCDVLVRMIAADGNGPGRALLKEYRGSSAERLLLWQHNPPGPVEIPLNEVSQVYRVLTTAELIGG